MIKSYYGFVYLWRDRLRKMSYIGSHMGSLNDTYKGSSARLLRAMKKRPQDFRRKVLWILTIDDRKLLLAEEERWLQMIRPHHLQVRYYNVKRRGTGGFVTEGYTPEQRATYVERLSRSRRGRLHYAARACHCAGQNYDTLADAKRFLGWDPIRKIKSRKHADFYFIDQGRPAEDEINTNIQTTATNRRHSIDAMRAINIALPVAYHKRRTHNSGLVRRGAKWRKDISQRKGRKIYANGVTFANLKHASETLNVSPYLIRKRCADDAQLEWHFINE